MGIAASQARYLYLTARQTNVEFEGQQINQARTNLANEQAGIFNKMLEVEAPIVPSYYDISAQVDALGTTEPDPTNTEKYPGGKNDPQYKADMELWVNSAGGTDANAAYNIAMNEYHDKQTKYDKYLDDLNAQSEEIHQRDQVLELQLRQLDTEQETIVTELESVKKVIEKNIEIVFKTFQS